MTEQVDSNEEEVGGVFDGYTPEQIEKAQNEIENMTAEEYLELLAYLNQVDRKPNHSEASGIAFSTLYDESGQSVCNVTCRGNSALEAAEELFATLRVIKVKYGLSAVRKWNESAQARKPVEYAVQPDGTGQQPQPQPQPSTPEQHVADGGASTKYQVRSLSVAFKKDSTRYLSVKCGHYVKFGIPAYPESWPPGLDISQLQPNVEYQPRQLSPDGWLDYATVTGKKVTAFSQS